NCRSDPHACLAENHLMGVATSIGDDPAVRSIARRGDRYTRPPHVASRHTRMSRPESPFETNPPSGKRLLKSVLAAIAVAAVVLVAFVLPAEFGIDPIGAGRALGLTAIHAPPTRTLQMKDVIGGNEKYREVKLPADPRDPVPLPNPAVSQLKQSGPRTDTVTVKLEPGQQTEVKAILDAAQVILYSWKAE